ncbi:hypothetical protein L6452_18003 [Arctium lappa]|uniref:Uncharacterized protein n=1 Tax=Arctium lappa TaxID=4217 RepID=A0ACB9C4U2_ARCLA|nr:hypothetical protein L6452_18003 [Arctium lappa]
MEADEIGGEEGGIEREDGKRIDAATHLIFIFNQLTLPSSSLSAASLSLGNIDGDDEVEHRSGVTHHSLTQVLKNFNEIWFLKIELPSGDLGIEDDVLLTWQDDFRSTLENCIILCASFVIYPDNIASNRSNFDSTTCANVIVNGNDDNDSNPKSFYTNGDLKLGVVWTISSSSTRHFLFQPIISEHKTLDSLVLTDADGQGV